MNLKEIKAKCEAATGDPGILYGKRQRLFVEIASIDTLDLIAEVERLQPMEPALRNLYNDCRNESCDEQRGKVMDEARKALEQE